jgi:hypothetical protein
MLKYNRKNCENGAIEFFHHFAFNKKVQVFNKIGYSQRGVPVIK